MIGRRVTQLFLALAVVLSRPVESQTQNIASLRQAIAQAGGRVIITLKPGHGSFIRAPGSPPVSQGELTTVQARLQNDYPVQMQGQLPMIGALVATVADADVARLAADSNVDVIEPDVKTYLTTAMSSKTIPASRPARLRADVVPWGVTDVGAPTAWASGLTGAGVKVGIMDTGIDYTHPDLNVVGGYDFTTSSPSPVDYNDTFASCDGHGTHVAGTVAALQNGSGVVGVAPGASLYALKVFTDYGTGCFAFLSAQIVALQWAVTNHLDVVSISIGNSVSAAYASAVASANAAGVVVVAAAGNNGGPGVLYPAAAPGAIAVSALDPGNTLAGYSSTGPEVSFAAPGSNVLSTIPGGGTGTKSGTSMAAPHVTGVVALIRQAHPTWTVAQVVAQLKSNAVDLTPAGFDNNTGWGLVQAPTLGGSIPVTVAVTPAARSTSVQQGNAAPSDNATVTLSGTNAGTTAWSATKKKSWLTLTTSSGTGSGTVAWTRNATGLAVGTYVDTVTVTAASSSAIVYDTLKITAPPVPVTVAVNPSTRAVSVQQGNAAPGDNATVTLSGTNAGTTAWSATKKKSWLTLTTSSGTGSGTVAWTRNATGLAVGTYVDTITVTAAASSATVYDTLKITAPPIPVTVAVNPLGRAVSVQQGNAAPSDNAAVTLSGTNAGTTAWSATKKQPWLTLTTSNGTGSGTVAWNRNATGLAVGTYVDTITVTAASSSAVLYDTLKITAAPIPVTVAVSPSARVVSVQQGNAAPGDNATVTLSGTNAGTTAWSATKKKSWLTLSTSNGTGSGSVAWTRNATGLAVGTYVDTITVTAAASSAIVYDTLKITAAPIPVTVAVNPSARSVSVQQGSTAPSDNATVTLSGTNAGTTTWSATKKKTWLTLSISSGTGSGTVAWTRNATGLAVGTYVDTITVSAAASSATVYDTLKITAAPVPVTVAVSPSARSVSVQQGNAAPSDNATVTLSGTNAGTTAWSATKKKAWLTLSTSSGTGSGTVTWTRNATGLAVGTYVDTITVAAASSSATVYDTLKITAAPIPVTVAVSPSARSVSVQQGNAAPSDNATVTLSGTNSTLTTWTATKKKAWLTLTTASATGNGTVAWSRNPSGLAVGTYVDTITVSAAASSAVIYDTLKITAAPIPVTVAVNPSARTVSVQQGNAAPGDNATVTLSGTNASSTSWSATRKKSWLTLTTSTGTGSGTVAWTRNATGLAGGTYVDTITVSAAASSAIVYDTLKVTAAPIGSVTVAVNPAARSVSVQQGNAAAGDNAAVTLSGTNAATTAWSATKKQPWLTLTVAGGTGSGTVTWTRNATALAVGTYVDTITVSAGTSSAQVYDTLKITAAPIPVTVAVNPAGRSVSVQQSSAAPGDNGAVTLSGTNAATTLWSATKKKSWLTLTTASGMGTGTVAWTRNAIGLAVGTYVDTITVTAAASSATIYDTLRITAVSVPVTVAVSPGARAASVQQGNLAPSDNATVTLAGTNAGTTPWSATKTQPWLTLTSASGAGNGLVVWNRNAAGLAVGTYVDTITVTAAASFAVVYDTLKVTPAPIPLTVAVSPASRNVTVQQGSPAVGDNATVTVAGTNAAVAGWSATKTASWATILTPSGTGSGVVSWNRNTAGLAPGVAVDTITITLAGSGQSAQILDSVKVLARLATIVLAPGGKTTRSPVLSGATSHLVLPEPDSALVEATALDSTTGAGWVATVSSARLVLTTPTGTANTFVKWSRSIQGLDPGIYVDTVVVSLQSDASVRAMFFDSLEVVVVTVPTPDVAVGDLFDHGSLSADQRIALDRQGNNNGSYDLGDFLAWVSRNHIQLSPATALRMKQLAAPPSRAGPPEKP